MHKFLFTLLFALLALPSLSFAAFDDATLTTDVVINVASLNLNLSVSGSSAVVESIVVGASSFDVVLQSGSSITIASSDRWTFTLSPSSGFTSSTSCNSNQSTLTLSGTKPATVTVIPTSLTCTVASSGGGGGGPLPGTFDKPTGPFSVVINSGSAVTKTRDVALKLQAGSNAKSMAISSQKADLSDATLVNYQPTATWDICSKLGGLVKSPEAECKEGLYTIYVRFYTGHGQPSETYSDTIEYQKSGVVTTGIPQITTNLFTRTLSLGSTGEDVKLLQKTLNSLGFIITSSGVGSQGNETTYFGGLTMKAVGKFQKAHGIDAEEYGRVDPKTLAKLRELAKIPAQDSTLLTSIAFSMPAFNRRLSLGITGDDVKRLQQLLNKNVDTQIASSGIGSPGNESTYFGSLTEKAVQKFQIKYGIASSGSAQMTGFGAVGPKTQAKLQEIFGQ